MGSTDRDEAQAQPKIKRWALGLITTAASVVGLAPLALLVNGLRALPFVAVAVAAIASWELRSPQYKRPDFTAAKLPEFLLAAVAAVFWFSFIAIIVMVVSGLILGLSHLVELVISNKIHLRPQPIVFWLGSVLLVAFGTICTVSCISSLRGELYPDRWGGKSAYYNLIVHERSNLARTALIFITLAILAAVVVSWLRVPIAAVYICLEIYVFLVSATTLGSGSRIGHKAVQAIERLLIAAGYAVRRTVFIGDETVDSMLAVIDLVATHDQRVFALDIKTERADSTQVQWESAAALRTAALTYGTKQAATITVEPVMVLVGVEPSESLLTFAKSESLSLRSIPLPVIEEILKTTNIRKLRDLADKHLHLQGQKVTSDTSGGIGGNP